MNHAATMIPLADICLSTTNPRRHRDGAADAELTESVKKLGVLQPVLVRPAPAPTKPSSKPRAKYELVVGSRRLAAAAAAGLTEIPATERELTDVEVLEIQIVENLQRSDVHPLEEAEAYVQLHERHKYDVEKIAERVGRSGKYVYDRMRLMALVPEAQNLFRDNRITAGHAILLARLKAADQRLALDEHKGGVLEHEDVLWKPEDEDRPKGLADHATKARSVRELQGWIDEHIKFDVKAPDVPQLFPETAAAVQAAQEQASKLIPITHSYHVQNSARDGQRVFGPMSWRRADGSDKKSKRCDHATLGVIVVGPGRGEAFDVCTSKTCVIHWAYEIKQKQKHASGAAKGGHASALAREKAQRERAAQLRAHEEAERTRWKKAVPELHKAIAAAVSKMPAGATGKLADRLVKVINRSRWGRVPELVKRGRTADDLVRYLAFSNIADQVNNDYHGPQEFPALAKLLGIDLKKILAKFPIEKPKTAKPGPDAETDEDVESEDGDE